MHFVDSRPGVIRSINQRWLLNYWLRIRCDHTLPAWPGLGAEELARLTESLTYSDVVENPAGTDLEPWVQAGATWCLTSFSNQPQLSAVRDAIAAGP